MSAPSDMVYVAQDITAPTEVQYNFSNQYDLNDPDQARASYQRIMHEHTKQQFQIATQSSRRRHSPAGHDMAGLTSETSLDSVDSSDMHN